MLPHQQSKVVAYIKDFPTKIIEALQIELGSTRKRHVWWNSSKKLGTFNLNTFPKKMNSNYESTPKKQPSLPPNFSWALIFFSGPDHQWRHSPADSRRKAPWSDVSTNGFLVGGWTNPIWKICSSQNKKSLSCHHLDFQCVVSVNLTKKNAAMKLFFITFTGLKNHIFERSRCNSRKKKTTPKQPGFLSFAHFLFTTVDGRNPAPPGMYKP